MLRGITDQIVNKFKKLAIPTGFAFQMGDTEMQVTDNHDSLIAILRVVTFHSGSISSACVK